jgi:glycosyltransferase involved in cell wall biosynthesis
MRAIVYPHDLATGGSQLIAIDCAAEVARLGHEVVVVGHPGPLVDRIDLLGLEFVALPRPRLRPTPSIVSALRREVRRRGIDVVHGYEWPPTLEALLATSGTRAAACSTVLSMSVAPFIPTHVPLTVGTEQIRDVELARGRRDVELIEPPVDTRLDSPDVDLPLEQFADRWGIDRRALTLVTVSRLVAEMKLEGILTAVDAVGRLARGRNVQLVVAGGGEAADRVGERAAAVNDALGRRVVVVTGELAAPRPAYAVADVVLGMGSSALRGMAFGAPLVVQGVGGYWELLTEESLPTFLRQGWFGKGPGAEGAVDRLTDILAGIADDEALRRRLGALSLRTVRDRFSLAAAARRLVALYERAAEADAHRSAGGTLRSTGGAAGRFLLHQLRTGAERMTGRAATEDFNSRPTLGRAR